MQWFYDWWNALNMLQQSFAVVAIPATVMLVLQTVLLLIGLGGHDADHGEMADDHSGLGDHGWDHDAHEFDHGAEHAFDHDDHEADDHDTHDPRRGCDCSPCAGWWRFSRLAAGWALRWRKPRWRLPRS